jgi:hypothetical protein
VEALRGCYRPRRAKGSPLFRLVHEYWHEFEAVKEERFESRYGPLRPVVPKTVEAFLRCGILDHGFARIRCEEWGHEFLLAFSCKGRGLCPSCHKKRQVAFGVFVTSEVLEAVPHRQVVFTVPRRLRLHFRYDRKLLAKLSNAAYRVVERAMREALGPGHVVPGGIAAIQTFGSLLDLNPHVHLLVTWGGFRSDGSFVKAPAIPADVLEKLFQHEVLKTMLRAGAVQEDLVENLLSWTHSGFDVHVGHEISGGDRPALEAVAEYIARGPVSLERLEVDETGPTPRVIYRSPKVHPRHGADFRIFDPLEFLAALIPHIPGTHEKTVLYYGWYSHRTRGERRKRATPPQASNPRIEPRVEEEAASLAKRRWAQLIRKVYEVDPLLCQDCGGLMKVISFITDENAIYRILTHLDLLEPDPPPKPPPREDLCAAALAEVPSEAPFNEGDWGDSDA